MSQLKHTRDNTIQKQHEDLRRIQKMAVWVLAFHLPKNSQRRVFMYLSVRVGRQPAVFFDPNDMARDLDISVEELNRSLDDLVSLDLIRQVSTSMEDTVCFKILDSPYHDDNGRPTE